MRPKLTFLACFFICANCFAQQYPFVYYTPRDGLVNSRVRCTRQDSKGRLYFITYGGLSVYDGTKFTNYGREEGLADILINDILEITPDSFLVSTNTHMLNTLVHGRIGVYKTADGFYPVVNHFYKTSDGNITAVADDGLYYLHERKFIHYPMVKDGKDFGFFLERLIEYKDFFLLIPWNPDLKEKLILYNRKEKKITDVSSTAQIFSIEVDRKQRIWISELGGINLLDTAALLQGKIVFQPLPPEYSKILKPGNASIFIDSQNNFWFYSGNNIQKISPELESEFISAEQGLKAGSLANIFQDREGTIWMASDGNGVIKIRSTNVQLINKIQPYPALYVTAIFNQNDTVWFYNEPDNSIMRWHGGEVSRFALKEKLPAANLYVIGKKIYVGGIRKMVCIEDKNNAASYLNAKPILDDSRIVLGNGVADNKGTLIQYMRYNNTVFTLAVIKNDKIIQRYPIPSATDQFVLDKQQRLWIATRGDNLLLFSLHPGSAGNYLQLEKDFSKEIPQFGARSIVVDDNIVWIGTRYNGLYQLVMDGNRIRSIKQFTTKDGLTDNFIYCLACGHDSTVWVGTQTGLDKIFLKNGKYLIANVTKNNNVFQTISRIVITKDKTVWATNTEGTILKIKPSSAGYTPHLPELVLTGVTVNNNPADERINHFSYRQNNFSFTVAAPSFIDEKSVKYSYQLSGSGNANWSAPSNNSLFNFINLSPGKYDLNIRADFPEVMYPSQMISYSFTIAKPWWQTWWFRIIMAMAAMAVLITVFRFYYNRKLEKQKVILEKQQAIEKERTRIATDMHDDLGAGLSRIKFLSETIGIKKQQQQPIEEEISRIREYSHEMINKMGEIVWALNEKNDSLSDLLSYTRAYAVEYLSQNGIGCEVTMPDQLSTNFVSGEFRRNIFLSVKEILHNVVKHSQACDVIIDVKADQALEITISDNGIGFDKKNTRLFSNGLHNIGKRMKDIHGNAEIKNDNGTTIILKAPL